MLVGLAFAIDWLVGEPRWLYRRLPHPIVLIGAWAGLVERWLNRAPQRRAALVAGALGWALVVLPLSLLAWAVQSALLAAFGLAGLIVVAVLASAFIAYRSLEQHVARVAQGLEQGLDAGREAVSHIVGRDTDALDASGVARASLESLAENFSDGVVAPLFWLALGGLPALVAYKAINTLDSMWGYRNARYVRFGRVAARLDDAANWLPARLSGWILVGVGLVTRSASARQARLCMQRDAAKHASPNAGWPEAALAGALGIRLGGPRGYAGSGTVDASWLGPRGGRAELSAGDIRRGLRLYRNCGFVVFLLCVLVGAGMIGAFGVAHPAIFSH